MSIISQEQIQQYVPQHPPFLMVDALEHFEEKKAISSFTILDSNVLVENNFFSAAGMIENIAQTCALHSGYQFISSMPHQASNEISKTNETKAPVGFIGSIKDFTCNASIQVGDTIYTHIIIEHSIANASVVKGYIYLKDIEIASCEMKIFLAG